MIAMVIITTILMLIGIDKSPIYLLCCFASFSATLMEGWNNFGPTPVPLSVFVPYNFNFRSKDQRYKKEGLDPNKGSTQLYVEISNKRSNADFTVGQSIYIINFLLPIFRKARPSFFRVLHTVIRLSLDIHIPVYR